MTMGLYWSVGLFNKGIIYSCLAYMWYIVLNENMK